MAVAMNEGVLQLWPLAKYAVAFPKISRSIFTRASSARSRLILHLLGAHRQAASAFELALPMALDPVEQRLVNHSQRSGCCCDTLPALDQPDRLLLEFERVARP